MVEWRSRDLGKELAKSISMDSASFHLPLYGFVGFSDIQRDYLAVKFSYCHKTRFFIKIR